MIYAETNAAGRARPPEALRRLSLETSPQRRQIRGHVASVAFGDAELRHRGAGFEPLRMFDPGDHPDLDVREASGDIAAARHVRQLRSHAAVVVTGHAAVRIDQV